MFTLTISDKPVAITNAEEDEARELLMSDDFKEDLKVLESDGAPFGTASRRSASGQRPTRKRPSSRMRISTTTRTTMMRTKVPTSCSWST